MVLLFQRAVVAVVVVGGNGDNPYTLPQTLYWALDAYFSCICLFDLYRNPRVIQVVSLFSKVKSLRVEKVVTFFSHSTS